MTHLERTLWLKLKMKLKLWLKSKLKLNVGSKMNLNLTESHRSGSFNWSSSSRAAPQANSIRPAEDEAKTETRYQSRRRNQSEFHLFCAVQFTFIHDVCSQMICNYRDNDEIAGRMWEIEREEKNSRFWIQSKSSLLINLNAFTNYISLTFHSAIIPPVISICFSICLLANILIVL